jgi:hypothetical protein
MMDDAFIRRVHFIRSLRKQILYEKEMATITTAEEQLRGLGYIPCEDFFPYDFFDSTFQQWDGDDEDDPSGAVV